MKALRTRHFLFAGLFAVLLAGPDPTQAQGAPKNELTIRNLTKESVVYTLSRLYDAGPPAKHTIRPDALDRIACSTGLDVKFERRGQTVSYRLDCGSAYTFRHSRFLSLLSCQEAGGVG